MIILLQWILASEGRVGQEMLKFVLYASIRYELKLIVALTCVGVIYIELLG